MKLQIRNRPDFYSGLMFIGIGIVFAGMASRYRFGSAGEMGPAYFPLVLAGLLAVLGAVIALRGITSLDEEEVIQSMALGPLVLVLGSVALFALLLVSLGLVVASLALVVLSSFASHEFNLRYATISAIVLTAACYLIFVVGLNLPMRVWPGVQ